MSHTKLIKSAGRFGPRYGLKIRKKIRELESLYRNKRVKCPYCNYESVKRIAFGIWYCEKCGKKFASKAYSPW